jgi:hypothetical protein
MPALTDPLGWFTLQFPDEWSQETEDCVTIFRTRHGVVYVSGGRHAGGKQQNFGGADFLVRFLRSIGIAIEEDEVVGFVGPGCRIYYYRREGDGSYWRYWSVTDDETALLRRRARRQGDRRGRRPGRLGAAVPLRAGALERS